MAKPTTVTASKLSIWLGDGASPETFVAPCGLSTRGITFTADTNDVTVEDCDDPDLPAWKERVVQSLSAGVSGSGVLAIEALPAWRDFFLNAIAKNCRVVIDHVNAGRFEGAFICSAFHVTGNSGQKVNTEITLQSDGEITWVDAT